MLDGLLVKVDQSKLYMIGKMTFAEESLNLPRGAAPDTHNPSDATGSRGLHGHVGQALYEIVNAVAMGFGRRLLQKPVVDYFCKQSAAFERVAAKHVHHLVIAGVAERFGKRAVKERRTE